METLMEEMSVENMSDIKCMGNPHTTHQEVNLTKAWLAKA